MESISTSAMLVVGLTGGIGCGKTAAAEQFAALGVPVVDTDLIARQLTAPGSPVVAEIAEALGRDCLLPDHTLDRAWVRQRVFDDATARQRLEAILHPKIRQSAVAALQRNASQPAAAPDPLACYQFAPYQLVVVPLLFETGGYADLIQRSLVIDCDESLQISRTMARSGLDSPTVQAIMRAQLPRCRRLELADDVITNNGTPEALARQVAALHQRYLAQGRKTRLA